MRAIDWLAVTIVLLFAAGLRIIGISYGQLNPDYFPSYTPYGMAHEQLPIQPDEFFNVSIPVNMTLRNRLNPEFFNYPSFIINTNFILFNATGSLEGLSRRSRGAQLAQLRGPSSLRLFTHVFSIRWFDCAGWMLRHRAHTCGSICRSLRRTAGRLLFYAGSAFALHQTRFVGYRLDDVSGLGVGRLALYSATI